MASQQEKARVQYGAVLGVCAALGAGVIFLGPAGSEETVRFMSCMAAALSAPAGGFFAASMAMLLTAARSERVARLVRHHYCDNLPRAAVTGAAASAVTILAAFALLAAQLPGWAQDAAFLAEVIGCLVQLVFGMWDARQIMYVCALGLKREEPELRAEDVLRH